METEQVQPIPAADDPWHVCKYCGRGLPVANGIALAHECWQSQLVWLTAEHITTEHGGSDGKSNKGS